MTEGPGWLRYATDDMPIPCAHKGAGSRNLHSCPSLWKNLCVERINVHCSLKIRSDEYTAWVKKIPPEGSWHFSFFFTNGWEFLIDFLHTFYTFLSTLDYKFLFNYSRFLPKLCHIKRDYPVHIMGSKCPQSAETLALTRLRKSLIAMLIVVCGK